MKHIQFILTDKEYEKLEKFYHDSQRINAVPPHITDVETFIKELVLEASKGFDLSNINDLMQQMKTLMTGQDFGSLFSSKDKKKSAKTKAKEKAIEEEFKECLESIEDGQKYKN